MQLFKDFWMSVKTLQHLIAAIAIVIMALITLWCIINNVDPLVDTARIEAIRTYEVHKARSERAHKNVKAIDAAIKAYKDGSYYHEEVVAKIPDPTARVRMHALIVLTDIWTEQRETVLYKYRKSDFGSCGWKDGCMQDMLQTSRKYGFNPYDQWTDLLYLYRVHGIESVRDEYQKVIDGDWVNNPKDPGDRSLELELQRAYPDKWAEKQADEALTAARKAERQKVRDDIAAFDVAYAGASEVGKTLLVLTETAKASAGWTAILLVVVVCGFGWLHTETEKYRGSFPTRDLGATKNGVTYEVTVPSAMFHRPTLSSACHKNWKAGVDFWGRTVLRDRMGNRVVVDGLHSSFVGALLASESLLAFAATGYQNGEALREAKSAVQTRNRLLVLVVEALRKSTDFQRSKVIGAIRENLIKRMNKEIGGDTGLWSALVERQEEEGLSEQATQ